MLCHTELYGGASGGARACVNYVPKFRFLDGEVQNEQRQRDYHIYCTDRILCQSDEKLSIFTKKNVDRHFIDLRKHMFKTRCTTECV